MEKKFILSCESAVDLPYSYISGRDISVIFYTYSINGELFTDNMQQDEHNLKDFYEKLDGGVIARTSQINEYKYYDYFDKLLETNDVLHICMGTGMSPSYYNALMAKQLLINKYPERKFVILDSLCSSGGYGLLVDICADMKDKDKSIDEILNWVMSNRNKIHHYFFSTNIKFFKRSGRVNGPTAFISSTLGICPLMRLNSKGQIISYSKCVGVRRTVRYLFEEVCHHCKNGLDYNDKIIIYHSNSIHAALDLKRMLEEKFINIKGKIIVTQIGNIIGSHCGPGTVGVSFLGSEREK